MFRKVLIANRGEIAVRVIRALRELGIPSVAVHSDADRTALHVRMADEAVRIGPAPAAESYLLIDRIIEVATQTSAEAIHPGYGFLSESADFAAACEQARIKFIGPSSTTIRVMGSKTAARKLARQAGVPVAPGAEEAAATVADARRVATGVGYPVLLKASAGGGGKGMRRVDADAEIEAAYRDASSEAERSFGSADVYVEKLLLKPRHIEIQVLGDEHGNLIHLGERECSLQRRHQKVVEECPSPLIAQYPELRERMGTAALQIALAAGYTNAGTVEFLVDEDRNFHFLEMNTRLQVEHPVTELVTGIDLVHWQLRIAAGEHLTIQQEDVRWNGSAIECRIYAEDPDNQFFPSPGRIGRLETPAGPGVRLDSGVYPGWNVPIDYDPLLAKLAVWSNARDLALARMRRALEEYSLGGIKTNLGFFRELLGDSEFQAAGLHTSFLDEFMSRREAPNDSNLEEVAALAAAHQAVSRQSQAAAAPQMESRWKSSGRAAPHR